MKRHITLLQLQKELAKAGAPFDVIVEAGVWFEGLPTVDFDPREVQREIVEGAARCAYASAVMNEAEEHGYVFESGRDAPNIEDQIRPTPPRVLREAKEWAQKITKTTGRPLWVYYLYAITTPGKHEHEPTPHSFGWSMVWQSQRAGSRWDDYHPTPTIALDPPTFEFYGVTRGDFKGLEKRSRR